MLDFLQQLFRPRGARPAGWRPAAQPTPAQARRYRDWLAGPEADRWLGAYFKAYHLLKGGLTSRRGPRVELLREPGRQGALFLPDDELPAEQFGFLYQLLGERVTQLGYHRACHDHRQRREQHLREHAEKQLFKPNPTNCAHSGRCNQRFGLVHLDLVHLNGQPLFIRLSVNPVCEADAHFTPAQSFEGLLAAVCAAPAASPQPARAAR